MATKKAEKKSRKTKKHRITEEEEEQGVPFLRIAYVHRRDGSYLCWVEDQADLLRERIRTSYFEFESARYPEFRPASKLCGKRHHVLFIRGDEEERGWRSWEMTEEEFNQLRVSVAELNKKMTSHARPRAILDEGILE